MPGVPSPAVSTPPPDPDFGPSGYLPSTSDPSLGNMTFAVLADVFAEQAQVRLVLRPEGDREVTFDGRIRLGPASSDGWTVSPFGVSAMACSCQSGSDAFPASAILASATPASSVASRSWSVTYPAARPIVTIAASSRPPCRCLMARSRSSLALPGGS